MSVDIVHAVALGLRRAGRGRPLKVLPYGDSIAAGSSAQTDGLWAFGTGFAPASIYMAGPRLQIIGNAGVAGEMNADIYARVADVVAQAPDVVLLGGGTNDLSSGMTDAAITSMMDSMEMTVAALLDAAILPVICTPPPKDAAKEESRKVQWFYYALAQHYGLPLIDLFRICVDASAGGYLSGYSADGVHPGPTAVAKIAPVAGAILANLEAAVCPPYMAAYSESTTGNFANLIRNGAFSYSTFAPNPDFWTVQATGATVTLEDPVYPYTGKTFKYVKASGSGIFALQGSSSGQAVGDQLLFTGRIKSSGLTPASAAGFTLQMARSPSGGVQPLAGWLYNGDFVFAHPFTVPASTTALTPVLGVSDNGTYEVNNLTLFNVTAANAIWQPGQQ